MSKVPPPSDSKNAIPPGVFRKENLARNVLAEWQELLDNAAEILGVPAGLITHVDGGEIEIFLSSRTRGNPYTAGTKTRFPGSGFYCEYAIKKRQALMIPDARKDLMWKDNPAVAVGMTSYAGVPIESPDGSVFGTICFLDSKENAQTPSAIKLINVFKRMVELSLSLIYSAQEVDRHQSLLRGLSMLYPICSFCKRVRTEDGRWVSVESYIEDTSGSIATHGVCPECLEKEMKR